MLSWVEITSLRALNFHQPTRRESHQQLKPQLKVRVKWFARCCWSLEAFTKKTVWKRNLQKMCSDGNWERSYSRCGEELTVGSSNYTMLDQLDQHKFQASFLNVVCIVVSIRWQRTVKSVTCYDLGSISSNCFCYSRRGPDKPFVIKISATSLRCTVLQEFESKITAGNFCITTLKCGPVLGIWTNLLLWISSQLIRWKIEMVMAVILKTKH